ncbi:MAG: hypothetical protein HC803_01695 [Saprospiraceae bacterium]|nr:hypothetical protein [Saprospiraceae bacterium]
MKTKERFLFSCVCLIWQYRDTILTAKFAKKILHDIAKIVKRSVRQMSEANVRPPSTVKKKT